MEGSLGLLSLYTSLLSERDQHLAGGGSVSKTCMAIHSEVEAGGLPSRQVISAPIAVFPKTFGDGNGGVSLVSEMKENQVES